MVSGNPVKNATTSTEYLNQNAMLVYSCLPEGREASISLREIAARTNIKERNVKMIIQCLRNEGYPIVSSCSRGYFIPCEDNQDDIEEAERFCKMQHSQAINRFKSSRSVKKWLKRVGQSSFEDAENGR